MDNFGDILLITQANYCSQLIDLTLGEEPDMEYSKLALEHNDSAIIQFSTPVKMLIACIISCILGAVLMGVTSNYLLMAVFLLIMLCVSITTPLILKGKIRIETACIAPMLILCFV